MATKSNSAKFLNRGNMGEQLLTKSGEHILDAPDVSQKRREIVNRRQRMYSK